MKRLGKTANIIDEIAEYGNISDSIDVVLRGKKRKRARTGRSLATVRTNPFLTKCERKDL